MHARANTTWRQYVFGDVLVVLALAAFLLFKGVVTFFLLPLGGPTLHEYIEPLAELLIASITITFAVSRRSLRAAIGSSALLLTAVLYWSIVIRRDIDAADEFKWFVMPELGVSLAALLNYMLHKLRPTPIYGD